MPVVTERYVPKRHPFPHRRQDDRTGALLDLRLCIHQFKDPPDASHSMLNGVIHLSDLSDGLEEKPQGDEKGQQLLGKDEPPNDQVTPQPHHKENAAKGQDLHDRR